MPFTVTSLLALPPSSRWTVVVLSLTVTVDAMSSAPLAVTLMVVRPDAFAMLMVPLAS